MFCTEYTPRKIIEQKLGMLQRHAQKKLLSHTSYKRKKLQIDKIGYRYIVFQKQVSGSNMKSNHPTNWMSSRTALSLNNQQNIVLKLNMKK